MESSIHRHILPVFVFSLINAAPHAAADAHRIPPETGRLAAPAGQQTSSTVCSDPNDARIDGMARWACSLRRVPVIGR
jgi:hypothetical protein